MIGRAIGLKLAGVAVAASLLVGFGAGWKVKATFFEAAASRAKDAVIAGLKQQHDDLNKIITTLTLENEESDARFENVELAGGSCTVFDDDSLRLLNQALGHKPVPEAVSGADGGSGQVASP